MGLDGLNKITMKIIYCMGNIPYRSTRSGMNMIDVVNGISNVFRRDVDIDVYYR
jgi:hypothetical protein